METSQQPFISVIVPIYNTEKYIQRCLDSILENTYQNLEIICVNDGSDDGSADILQGYAEKRNIVIINQKNQGVSAARNAGLEAAKGEYISFVDSDDCLHPRFFETLTRLMDQGADIAVCEKLRVDDSYIPCKELPASEKISQFNSDSAFGNFLVNTYVWGRIYKKSILQNIRFAEEITRSEDSIFNICVFAQNPALKILATDMPLYYHYMRAQSITHTIPHKSLPRGEYFLKVIDRVSDPRAKWIYVGEIYKSTLAYRCDSEFTTHKREAYAYSKQLFSRCREIVRSLPTKPMRYWIYYLMEKTPMLYRVFRDIKYPYMRRREKAQKKAMKEQKRKSTAPLPPQEGN